MATDKDKLKTLLDATKAKLVTTPIVTSNEEEQKTTQGQKAQPNQKK